MLSDLLHKLLFTDLNPHGHWNAAHLHLACSHQNNAIHSFPTRRSSDLGNQLATMAIRNLCGCGPPSSAPTVKMTPHAKGGGGSAKGGSGGGNGKGGGGGTNNQDKGMMTMSGHQLRFGHFEEHFSFRASRGLAV